MASSAASPSAPARDAHRRAAADVDARTIEAKALADTLPELLAEAQRVAASVVAGWHGRRRAGTGETFWQFRPFVNGEPAHRIDWRRSARDDHLYVREREWEAAHTIWLWADLSPRWRSAPPSPRRPSATRAVVLMIALAELAARGGERIGPLGLGLPIASRDAAERLATTLVHAPAEALSRLPDTALVRPFSDVVLIGDLLDPPAVLERFVGDLSARGVHGHLMQVLDPIEETFPFAGRTEFRDPETGALITAGRAEGWREAYRDRLAAHREAIRLIARRAGWSFILHHTDKPASGALLALRACLAGAGTSGATP